MPLICISSPKGGVGKTTLAANIAYEMACTGARVVALDADPQNELCLHFGLPLRDRRGLMPELRTSGRWQLAMRRTECGVWVIPYGESATSAGPAGNVNAMEAGAFQSVIQDILADNITTIVVDTPPGPSAALASIIPFTDTLVTVLLADAASAALMPVVEQGRFYGPTLGTARGVRHGYVLNQLNPLSRLSRITAEAVQRHVQGRLIGTVIRDEFVAEAVASQRPVAVFAPASRAARDIAGIAQALTLRLPARPQRERAVPTSEPATREWSGQQT
ncbi:MAG: cellulose synthase operon protein YhjQ/BcsQ [Acetobacteraceae bacterium]